jgi:hypothetical protein
MHERTWKAGVAFGLLILAISALAQAAEKAGSLTANSSASLADAPDQTSLNLRGTFYIPAYTSFLLAQGRLQIDLAVSLSIHNTSDSKPLVIERIAYYDTAGNLVQEYLNAPVAIRPLGTIQVSVAVNDTRGGAGANFVVSWAAAGPIAEPIMETLILGSVGTHGYSFVGQGRPIRVVGERQ